MNLNPLAFITTITLMITWSSCEAQVVIPDPDITAHSSERRESVTVTSDGKTTVKRTVTVINGVENIVTETTDEDGKTTRQESGKAIPKKTERPWIGIRVKEVPQILRDHLNLSDDEGLLVELVASNGPTEKAGIKAGDLLLALGEKPLASSKTLAIELLTREVGDKTTATIMRKGKRSTVDIELGKQPTPQEGKAPESLTEGFGKNSIKSVDVSANGEEIGTVFDSVLDDPKLPDNFKKSVQRMQDMLRAFEKQTGDTRKNQQTSPKN